MIRLLLLCCLLLGHGIAAAQQLKIATIAPEGSAWMREMRSAADEVNKATDGRVKIKYYPGGVMGNDAAVLRKIKLGQLQGGALTASELVGVNRDASLYGLPFLFRDRDEVDALRPQIDPLIDASFARAGFKLLSLSGVGFAYLMSSADIATPAAVAQRKVWAPENDAISERTFRAVGIAPIPLPLSDVFTALQSGLVDTVGNTPAGAIALQWHSRMRQLLNLPLSYIVGYLVVDQRSWAKLSADDQAAVLKAFAAGSTRIDADNRRADADALQALRDLGVQVVEPSADEVARWVAAGQQVADELVAEGKLDAALVGKLREALTALRSKQS